MNEAEIAEVVRWLTAHGFNVVSVAIGDRCEILIDIGTTDVSHVAKS